MFGALSAVVDALRAGVIEDTSSNHIVTVGHSLGSAVVAAHAVSTRVPLRCYTGERLDPDRIESLPLPGTALFFATATWPVRNAGGQRLPAGYRTTIPWTRRSLYAPGPVQRDVLAVDERLKETTANVREVIGRSLPLVYRTRRLSNPVLIITGSRDTVVCGRPGWLRLEARFFARETDVSIVSVAGSGHCLNTSPQAARAFSTMLAWCDTRVGAGAA